MLSTALLIVAFILFLMAALPVQIPGNLVPAGLACWTLSLLVGSGALN